MLAQKAQLHLPVLEKIDVTSQQYQYAQETETHCSFDHNSPDDAFLPASPDSGMHATLKAMIPRIAYVRGKRMPKNFFFKIIGIIVSERKRRISVNKQTNSLHR